MSARRRAKSSRASCSLRPLWDVAGGDSLGLGEVQHLALGADQQSIVNGTTSAVFTARTCRVVAKDKKFNAGATGRYTATPPSPVPTARFLFSYCMVISQDGSNTRP